MFKVELVALIDGREERSTSTHTFNEGEVRDNMAFWLNEPYITGINITRVEA